ncbi:YpiF family protein [Bacillus marinisedimentorum]|uniref:YpiF family protein n=1 Tax=Bacillus marinisedimentorum TaxID=1821260 RepID=UPI00087217D8|nr:YpiF family protein [Bacillus marinisedimentorum]
MNWNPKDVDMFLQAKEYVDTAVIPLLPVSLGKRARETAVMGEFTAALAAEVEREYKGRILHMPPFTYLSSEGREELMSRLKAWEGETHAEDVSHIFYITADGMWKSMEDELAGDLIWVPSVDLGSIEGAAARQLLTGQAAQLQQLIRDTWKEKETSSN